MTIETYLEDLGAYLHNAGLGTVGTDIFFTGLEPAVTNCIAIVPYKGFGVTKIVSQQINPYSPNISIIVQNKTGSVAFAKINTIYKLLRNLSNTQIGSTFFMSITDRGTPGFVSKSETGAFIYSVDFNLLIH